jgi:putative phage-type endonuclease
VEQPVRDTIETYSDQYWEYRKTCLGASEISALIGANPWSGPERVWADKRGAGRPQPDSGINTPIWWGHQEEPHIIKAALWELAGDFPPATVVPGKTWVIDGFMASPDAVFCEAEKLVSGRTEIIEAKVVGIRSGYLWRYGPPHHVLAQVHAQMTVTGSTMAHVAARIAGAPVKVWSVKRDEMACKGILKVVKAFWSYEEMPPHWEMITDAAFVHTLGNNADVLEEL